MTRFKGTKTEKNLMAAFAGEAQARNRYTYYSKVAIKEGYEQIGAIFLETAENELMHARLFFDFLGEEREILEVAFSYPIGLSTTVKNLENAFLGEMEENTEIYPTGGRVAEEEGFKDVASTFRFIVEVEKHHEARYRALHKNIMEETVFKKPNPLEWKCRKCGYIFKGLQAPPKCPCCHHPQAWFELLCDNF